MMALGCLGNDARLTLVLEPIAVALDLDDMAVVQQNREYRASTTAAGPAVNLNKRLTTTSCCIVLIHSMRARSMPETNNHSFTIFVCIDVTL